MLLIKLFRLGLGVAGFFLGILGFQGQLDKFCPQTLDLLFHHRPSVESFDHRAKASGGSDRLQPRHARADDKNARRSHRAGGSHEQGEELLQPLRRHQHRLIARDRAHGAQGVHGLSAGDPRHQLHGKRRRFARRQGLKDFRLVVRG